MHFFAKIVFTSLVIGRVTATVKCCQSEPGMSVGLCFFWVVGGLNLLKWGCQSRGHAVVSFRMKSAGIIIIIMI